MRKVLLTITAVLFTITFANAQILEPVKWSYAAKKTGKNEAIIFLKATIDDGWHIYSQHLGDGGPTKTFFKFTPSNAYSIIGITSEPTPITKYEDIFKMKVGYFEKTVVFQQKIKLKSSQTIVKGILEYGVCNDSKCLPPDEVAFEIPVK